MKKYLVLSVVLLALAGCKKQYMTSGPEVDLMKKGDAAYYARDWETLRSLYADTCKINVNQWTGHEITIDKFIEDLKASVADFTEVKQGPTPYYEAVVDDDGKVYGHAWQEWIGTHKNGKEIHTVVHFTLQIENGKAVWGGFIYDSAPVLMATHPADSTAAAK